ncbi:MAG: outer membrane protein assembly factor BamD [Crocinitomicaceae bacterium]|nr:outer membrane protein assembly factor BamD [Crocinitomicaceae bacterium]
MKALKQIIFLNSFVWLAITFSGCSEFNKVVKSNDNELKRVKALEYYEQGEYLKSVTLLEEILPFYSMTPEGEKMYFYYCMANYKMGDYYLSGYYFSRFIYKYPRSIYCEEAMFLSALCSVHNSPDYTLDQTETYNALDGLQVFIDMYPNSARIDTCNVIMDNLRAKLEKKQFEYAKLYYRTENYKAAVVALNSTLEKFPESVYEEEILYLLVLSNFELAINSISTKKMERLNETLKSYRRFVAEFPNSERLKELEGVKEKTDKEIQILSEQTAN